MDIKVVCRGARVEAASAMLTQVLRTLVARTTEKDPDLQVGDLDSIVVAEDYADALKELSGEEAAGGGVVRAVHRADGVDLLIDGGHMSAALAGDAEEVAGFVHLFHRELCRIHDARARLGESESLELLLDCEFDRHLLPIAESMWAEYFSTRRSVWSLPSGSDLLLNHLADLVDALPPAMNEEITLHLGSNDLNGLFEQSAGRVTHLIQTMAHCQGYLAGLGRPLSELAPEHEEQLQQSFLAEVWWPMARRLETLFALPERTTEALYLALQADIVAVFSALGLRIRRSEDGSVWLDPLPVTGQSRLQ